jgi:diadenosine tetraphosphate (Ap4A) HIT family hydrolase
MDCPFCDIDCNRIEFDLDSMFCIYDLHPVTEGHMLVIPKDHITDIFDEVESANGRYDVFCMIRTCQIVLASKDPTIQGFNIGINNGVVAGQTVEHAHIHVIPRRAGDVDDPTGGVRNVIPGKGVY